MRPSRAHRAAVGMSAALIAALILGGCTMQPTPHPKQLTGKQAFQQVVTLVELTQRLAGAELEPWKTSTAAENPDAPVWKPGQPPIGPGYCLGTDDAYQMTTTLFGGPSADAAATVDKVVAGWKSHGFAVHYLTDQAGDGGMYSVTAKTPDGASVGFIMHSDLTVVGSSSIDAQSACSTDPTLHTYDGTN